MRFAPVRRWARAERSQAGETPHRACDEWLDTKYTSRMEWLFDDASIDWAELSELYRVAPLGNKDAKHLQKVFSNSRYKCFVRDDGRLVGAGRALADGGDCSYLCDIAVHPRAQGTGLGKANHQPAQGAFSRPQEDHPLRQSGREGFYEKLGFRRMRTAMAIFADQDAAQRGGLIE
jgi:ribosomal protein S18 acetylase RimI-like enzyme